MKGDLQVDNDIIVKGSITSSGDSRVNGNQTVDKDLHVKGDGRFDKDLYVEGVTNTGALVSRGDAAIGGNIAIGEMLMSMEAPRLTRISPSMAKPSLMVSSSPKVLLGLVTI